MKKLERPVRRSWATIMAALLLALVLPVLALAETPSESAKVPGTVIDYIPAASGLYIGSPSLTVLTNGDYLASHDLFGPKSAEFECPKTCVFRSSDRGQSWVQVATLDCVFWNNLFTHRGAAYLMGTDKHHGRVVIRRSTDRGVTWTNPRDTTTGLLTPKGEYHTAPVPVVEHNGRLWRAFEDASAGTKWGERYQAGVLSVAVDADLLVATNWVFSNFLPRNPEWLGGRFRAWLEGNAVVTPDGKIVDILRVDTPDFPESAAIVQISADGRKATFDPSTGFVAFPGGAKKFSIRFDPVSGRYWSLASVVPERHQTGAVPGAVRNTLALVSSADLRQWETRCILLYHPDTAKHGFQYPDWHFEGDDLIAVVRTAFDDDQGGAHNKHDANFMTFHRIRNFRALTMSDSVPMPQADSDSLQNAARYETADLVIRGTGFEWARLRDGEKAFSNRTYVWQQVPAGLKDWQITRTAGGERGQLLVKAKRPLTIQVATTANKTSSAIFRGWRASEPSFCYTDGGRTRMTVFTRTLNAGEEVRVPQENWTGGILLLPPGTEVRR